MPFKAAPRLHEQIRLVAGANEIVQTRDVVGDELLQDIEVFAQFQHRMS